MGRLSTAINQQFGFFSAQGAVTVNANLTVNVAAIAAYSYVIGGVTQATAYSASTVTCGAADATNPRLDTVTINTSGTVAIVAGTAAADPVPATLSAIQLELCQILVGANVASLVAGNLTDRRQQFTRPILVASNTAEQTTTSTTAVDLVTISGLAITVDQVIRILVVHRKDASSANSVGIGLKLNSTVVFEASAAVNTCLSVSSALAQVEDGYAEVCILPRSANYLTGISARHGTRVSATGVQGTAAILSATGNMNALMPNATITSIAIRGINNVANNNLAVKEVYVYVE